MTEPAPAPGSSPGPPWAASSPAGAAVTTIAVPVTVWPATPAPGRCPASPGQAPCPRRYTSAAAHAVIRALSRPGDLVAAPRPGDEVFLAAAAGAGRRSAGHGGSSLAALGVVSACPEPACRPPGLVAGDANGGGDPGLPWPACQRVLRPGGLLAVITAAVWRPGWSGQLIAHARAAGLMYVQHVIVLHAALGDDRLLSSWPQLAARATPADSLHLPVHTDLLLFAQPGGPRHD
jgi:hypothetical protein